MAEPGLSPSLQILSQICEQRHPGDILAWGESGDNAGRARPCPGLSSAPSAARGALRLRLRLSCPDGCCSLTRSWGLRRRIFMSGSQDLALCSSTFAGRPEGAAHLAECSYADMSISINLPPSCSWGGSAQCQGLCSRFY